MPEPDAHFGVGFVTVGMPYDHPSRPVGRNEVRGAAEEVMSISELREGVSSVQIITRVDIKGRVPVRLVNATLIARGTSHFNEMHSLFT